MAQVLRKAQPDCLRYFLMLLRGPNDANSAESTNGREEVCTTDELISVLVNLGGYSPPAAKETVANALSDGLLMPVIAPRSRPTAAEIKRVRLPNSQEVRVSSSHDWYCYECHLPGILEHCSQCWRSFHRLCFRKNPERPNYEVPSSKKQKNRLPAFSSDTESDVDIENARNSVVIDSESDMASFNVPQQASTLIENIVSDNERLPNAITNVSDIDNRALYVEPKPLIEDLENKTKVDIVCLGQTRPPNRTRPNTTASSVSYKSEISQLDEDDQDTDLCTSCRLMKRAALYNPPNLQADELSHLVGNTFAYNREWLIDDVRSYLESNGVSANDINLVNHLLLYSPIKRLSDIELKLQRQEYELLMEFLVDMMDIQHDIGVFFGVYSTESESTKWLLRDVAHDLSEIRRCPDCFRYSHEKDSVVGFAKPCVQRHELVYAKHSGFPYWPAKVIRVLPSNKFDVRFFGGNHSRALIDVRHIKPIDSDVKSLKLGNSSAIKKAMEELRFHQALSTYPPSAFSFHANPHETENIIRTALGTSLTMMQTKRRGRKRLHKTTDDNTIPTMQNASICNASSYSDSFTSGHTSIVCPELTVSVKRLKPHQIKNVTNVIGGNITAQTSTRNSTNIHDNEKDASDVLDTMLKELEEKRKIIQEYKLKNEKLENEKRKLAESLNKMRMDEKIAKRKQWCYWCLKEAFYLCCFRAAYCSRECQKRHWDDGHSKVCKNPSNDPRS